MKLIDTNQRYYENMENRQQEKNFRYSFNVVDKRMNSSNPYVNLYEAQNDPEIKGVLRTLTPSQQKTIYDRVAGKDIESDPEVRIKMDNMVVTEDFYVMDAADLEEQMVGLSKTDKETYRRIRREANKDPASTNRARAKSITDEATQLFTDMSPKINGDLSNGAKEDRVLLQSEISKWMGNIPLNFKAEEQSAWIRKGVIEFMARRKVERKADNDASSVLGWIGEKITGVPRAKPSSAMFEGKPYFPPPGRQKAQGFRSSIATGNKVDTPAPPQPVQNKKTFSQLTQAEQAAAWDGFTKANGRKPKNVKELNEWMNKNGK